MVFIKRKKVIISIFLLLPLDKQTTVTVVGIFSPSLQHAEPHGSGLRKDRMKGSVFLTGTVSYLQCHFINIKTYASKKKCARA